MQEEQAEQMQEVSWTQINLESIDSTNNEAFRLYEQEGNEFLPALITADEQSSGRGQFEREWSSPKGNLYSSFCFSKSFLEWKLGQRLDEARFTLLIGRLLREVISETLINGGSRSEEAEKLTIKEPNDILYDGKKLAGILVEVKEDLVVIGIGVDIEVAPLEESICLLDIYQKAGENPDKKSLKPQLIEGLKSNLSELMS